MRATLHIRYFNLKPRVLAVNERMSRSAIRVQVPRGKKRRLDSHYVARYYD